MLGAGTYDKAALFLCYVVRTGTPYSVTRGSAGVGLPEA